MNIELIENGMELSRVREILNTVIQKINQKEETQHSYQDLADRPCINGVLLTAQTTARDLNLTLSQLGNVNEVENMVTQIVEQTTESVAKSSLSTKLDSDFSTLPEMRYNFNETMLLSIFDGSNIFKAKIEDLLLYLKYLILKDTTFGKLTSGGTVGKPETDTDSEERTPIGDSGLGGVSANEPIIP